MKSTPRKILKVLRYGLFVKRNEEQGRGAELTSYAMAIANGPTAELTAPPVQVEARKSR